MEEYAQKKQTSQTPRPGRAIVRWLVRAWLLYFAVVLIGLYPVNRNSEQPAEGIRVYAHPTGLHTDIIVPIRSNIIDWGEYFRETDFPLFDSQWDYIALGWGDRRFFLETPEWSDLTVANAAGALLWPSPTAMRVQLRREKALPKDCIRIILSEEDYAELADFLLKSFQLDSHNSWIHIADSGYGGADTFYESRGKYHLFNTCNTWTGEALKSAGLPVGWYLTWPGTTTLYLHPTDAVE